MAAISRGKMRILLTISEDFREFREEERERGSYGIFGFILYSRPGYVSAVQLRVGTSCKIQSGARYEFLARRCFQEYNIEANLCFILSKNEQKIRRRG